LRFLVAFARLWDLLLRVKRLFVATRTVWDAPLPDLRRKRWRGHWRRESAELGYRRPVWL